MLQLTFHSQIDRFTAASALSIDGHAVVFPRWLSRHFLQHQTDVDQDDTSRHVVVDLFVLEQNQYTLCQCVKMQNDAYPTI